MMRTQLHNLSIKSWTVLLQSNLLEYRVIEFLKIQNYHIMSKSSPNPPQGAFVLCPLNISHDGAARNVVREEAKAAAPVHSLMPAETHSVVAFTADGSSGDSLTDHRFDHLSPKDMLSDTGDSTNIQETPKLHHSSLMKNDDYSSESQVLKDRECIIRSPELNREIESKSQSISKEEGHRILDDIKTKEESHSGVDESNTATSCKSVTIQGKEQSSKAEKKRRKNERTVVKKSNEQKTSSSPSPSTVVKKKEKTVLPESLLQTVTELVRQGKVEVPKSELHVTHDMVKDVPLISSEADSKSKHICHCKQEAVKVQGQDDIAGAIGNTRNQDSVSAFPSLDFERIDTDGKGIIDEKNKLIGDEVRNELLEIDISDLEEKSSIVDDDHVYDLSCLFSGQLEKRRKAELKKAKKKAFSVKKKSKKNHKTSEGGGDEETGDHGNKETNQRLIPNYFVSIQIKDPQIHAELKKVQDEVVAAEKNLISAMNKLPTLHMTLMVLRLNTEEEMASSKKSLDEAMTKLQSVYKETALTLDIHGLGHFRNEVVFAKVPCQHQLSQLQHIANTVEDCFLENEIVSPEKKGFKPHITIMKLSRAKGLRRKGIKKIDEKFYQKYTETLFGSQTVASLQLCAMLKPKQSSGYYQVEHEVPFPFLPMEVDTSSVEKDVADTGARDSENAIDQGKEKDIAVEAQDSDSAGINHGDATLDEESLAENGICQTAAEASANCPSIDRTHLSTIVFEDVEYLNKVDEHMNAEGGKEHAEVDDCIDKIEEVESGTVTDDSGIVKDPDTSCADTEIDNESADDSCVKTAKS